ncbi:MAG: hypothetical protein ACYDH3_00645 [Candidatus Aminicenantales bacterium]
MDIFLTAEAVRTLRAVRRLGAAKGCRGFLLGHRRGDRIYVENALASPSAGWPSLKSFYELDADLGGKIIGFFLFGPAAASRKPLLQPFGTGKVLIESAARSGVKAGFRGALIDYRDRFEFRPLPVIAERPDR